MKSRKKRRDFLHDRVQRAASGALASHPKVSDEDPPEPGTEPPLDVLPLPDSVVNFLAQMGLQYGVPFEYLIADDRIIPPESMRFFYVDRNWIRRSIDGALSVGLTGTQEALFNQQFFESVYEVVDEAIPSVRTIMVDDAVSTNALAPTWSGVIFRSAVVSGYPGLEVKPYTSVDNTVNPPVGTGLLGMLRMERLAKDIMLCIFNGVPGYVQFRQPSEGIHFGIQRTDPTADTFEVSLRWLGKTSDPNDKAGKQISTGPGQFLTTTGKLRTGGQPGVVDVTQTTTAIKNKLGKTYLGNDEVFTSAEFAVEMVQSAGVQPYTAASGQPVCSFQTSNGTSSRSSSKS